MAVSSNMMRTLYERNWIRSSAIAKCPAVRSAGYYSRVSRLLRLKSLDQLPSLAELKDVETIGLQLEFSTA